MGANNFTPMYNSKRKTRIGNIEIEGIEKVYAFAIICLILIALSYGTLQMFTNSSNALGGALAIGIFAFITMYTATKIDYTIILFEQLDNLTPSNVTVTFIENEVHIEKNFKAERSEYYVLEADD